jgi:hypothetical protein
MCYPKAWAQSIRLPVQYSHPGLAKTEIPVQLKEHRMFPRRLICLLFALSAILVVSQAEANIVPTFFPSSDYSSNTATMDGILGVTGYTIDSFESTALIPGLTITLSGGVPTTTWSSLPAVFNGNVCPGLMDNQFWDGTDTVGNATGNAPNSCTSPNNISTTITFNYAPGTTSLGIGLSNFQSTSPTSPSFPVTNHELFVNGVDQGVLEVLAGNAWSPGIVRNAYLRLDATGGSTITSIGFSNLTGTDFLMFDHLAVQTAISTVPEPSLRWMLLLGVAATTLWRMCIWRRRPRPN